MGMKPSVIVLEDSLEIPQKSQNRSTIWPSHSTPWKYTQIKLVSESYLYPHVNWNPIITTKIWNKLRCPSADDQIDRENVVYILWYTTQPHTHTKKSCDFQQNPRSRAMDKGEGNNTKWGKAVNNKDGP